MGENGVVVSKLGRESSWIMKSKCVSGGAWHKRYSENVMAKCQLQY
jgi:hypothetical protein